MNLLINRLQFRKLVLTGALLLPLSLILSSFMRDIISLICLQAILCGKHVLFLSVFHSLTHTHISHLKENIISTK